MLAEISPSQNSRALAFTNNVSSIPNANRCHMIEAADSIDDLVEIHADVSHRAELKSALIRCKAILTGHFALPRRRHAPHAIRLRGVGQDATALSMVITALLESLPAALREELGRAKLLCPASAGFFLGHALSERLARPLAVTHTNLHRQPEKSLLAGRLLPGDRVVVVNDVASTGASIDVLRELVSERGAHPCGVILFAGADTEALTSYCAHRALPAHWLVSSKWRSHTPESDCPDCAAGRSLIPLSEFV